MKGWKVLLVFPQRDRQTGLFIRTALRDLGCIVQVVDPKTQSKKMAGVAEKLKPRFVLMSRTHALYPGILELRKKCPKTITACWNVDKRYHVKEFPPKMHQLFRECHIIYTVALGNVAQYKKMFKKVQLVRHLQQGCDPSVHRIEKVLPNDREKYGCEVMFAGSLHSCGQPHVIKQRSALIKRMSEEFNFKRYGERHNRVTDAEAGKAHLCSKIVLGHNGWPELPISMSVRDYKVMASGGFLLTQHCEGIDEWFEAGKMCETYKTLDECVEKIRYYLAHEEERKAIAQYGREVVLQKHKYIDRVRSMREDVEKLG